MEISVDGNELVVRFTEREAWEIVNANDSNDYPTPESNTLAWLLETSLPLTKDGNE